MALTAKITNVLSRSFNFLLSPVPILLTPVKYSFNYYNTTKEMIGRRKILLILAIQITVGIVAAVVGNYIANAISQPLGKLDEMFGKLPALGDEDRRSGTDHGWQEFQAPIIAIAKLYLIEPLVGTVKEFIQHFTSIILKFKFQDSVYDRWLDPSNKKLFLLSKPHEPMIKEIGFSSYELAFKGSEIVSSFTSSIYSLVYSSIHLWKMSSMIALPFTTLLVPDLLAITMLAVGAELFITNVISKFKNPLQEKMNREIERNRSITHDVTNNSISIAVSKEASSNRERLEKSKKSTLSKEVIFEVAHLSQEVALSTVDRFKSVLKYFIIGQGLYNGSLKQENANLAFFHSQQVSSFFKWWSVNSDKIAKHQRIFERWKAFNIASKKIDDTPKSYINYEANLEKAELVKFQKFSISSSKLPLPIQANLSIHEGQHIVLHGQSGVGKTTLAQAITGLIPDDFHTEGSINFSVGKKRILIIPQSPHFQSGVCLLDILTGENKHSTSTSERVMDYMKKLQVVVGNNFTEESLHNTEYNWQTLSGGQKKKLAVIKACLQEKSRTKSRKKPSKLLILDEVLTGLDPDSLVSVIGLLRETFPSASTISIDHSRKANYAAWERHHSKISDNALYTHEALLSGEPIEIKPLEQAFLIPVMHKVRLSIESAMLPESNQLELAMEILSREFTGARISIDYSSRITRLTSRKHREPSLSEDSTEMIEAPGSTPEHPVLRRIRPLSLESDSEFSGSETLLEDLKQLFPAANICIEHSRDNYQLESRLEPPEIMAGSLGTPQVSYSPGFRLPSLRSCGSFSSFHPSGSPISPMASQFGLSQRRIKHPTDPVSPMRR